MNKNIKILIPITFILAIIIAYFILFAQKDNQMVSTDSMENKQDKAVNKPQNRKLNPAVNKPQNKDNQMVSTDSIENKLEQTVPEPKSTESNSSDSNKSSYIEYSEDNLKMAENTKIVLFFHASWCPSCRALNSDIEKNIDKISPNVTILKTDYDKETALRKEYSVTSQHTLVQIDKNGTLIKKWSGGSKLENIISNIN